MYRGLSTVDKTGMDSVSLDVYNARKRSGNTPRHPHANHAPEHKAPLLPKQTNGMNNNGEYDLSIPEWLKNIKKPNFKRPSIKLGGLEMAFSIQSFRVFSFLLHMVSWILITYSWSKVGNSDFHTRLSSNAYTMTDTSSMSITMANRGLVTPMYTSNLFMGNTTNNALSPNPGFPALTTSTILRYTQPVMIRTDTVAETYSLSPSKSCTNYMLVNNNTAIWAACRASGVPMSLVDLTYLDNTLSLFANNNVIALMYQTFFITMTLSMATLPAMEWNMIFPWPMISILLLFGNFLFTICAPFTLAGAHFPINNAAITAAMHIVTISVILMVSKAKDRESNKRNIRDKVKQWGKTKVSPAPQKANDEEGASSDDEEPNGIDGGETLVATTKFKLHYLGQHLVSSNNSSSNPTYSNLWGRIHGNGSVTDGDVSEVIRIIPMDGNSANMEGEDMMHVGDVSHYGAMSDWMAGVNREGVFAMIPNSYFDYKWTENKENKLMMPNFR